jgi:hypothetical protein
MRVTTVSFELFYYCILKYVRDTLCVTRIVHVCPGIIIDKHERCTPSFIRFPIARDFPQKCTRNKRTKLSTTGRLAQLFSLNTQPDNSHSTTHCNAHVTKYNLLRYTNIVGCVGGGTPAQRHARTARDVMSGTHHTCAAACATGHHQQMLQPTSGQLTPNAIEQNTGVLELRFRDLF